MRARARGRHPDTTLVEPALRGLGAALAGPATTPREEFTALLRRRLVAEAERRSTLRENPPRKKRQRRARSGGVRLAALSVGLSVTGGGMVAVSHSLNIRESPAPAQLPPAVAVPYAMTSTALQASQTTAAAVRVPAPPPTLGPVHDKGSAPPSPAGPKARAPAGTRVTVTAPPAPAQTQPPQPSVSLSPAPPAPSVFVSPSPEASAWPRPTWSLLRQPWSGDHPFRSRLG